MACFKGDLRLSDSILPAQTLFLLLFTLWSHHGLLHPFTCSKSHFHSTNSVKYSKIMPTSYSSYVLSTAPITISLLYPKPISFTQRKPSNPPDDPLDQHVFKPKNEVSWSNERTWKQLKTPQNAPAMRTSPCTRRGQDCGYPPSMLPHASPPAAGISETPQSRWHLHDFGQQQHVANYVPWFGSADAENMQSWRCLSTIWRSNQLKITADFSSPAAMLLANVS